MGSRLECLEWYFFENESIFYWATSFAEHIIQTNIFNLFGLDWVADVADLMLKVGINYS